LQQPNNTTKSFTGNSLYIFAAKFFPALAFSIVWMVASKKIDPISYGLFQNFWTQLFVFSALGTIGFPVFILTYSPTKALGILKNIPKKSFFIYALFIGLMATGFGMLQQQNQTSIGPFASLTFILFIALILCDSLLIAFKSYKAIICINMVYALLFCGIHFYNIMYGFDLKNLLVALIILCSARLSFCLYFIAKKWGVILLDSDSIAIAEWASIKSLWLQLGINDVITVLFRWADKFILSLILAKELFAVYFNGSAEIPFLPILFSAVSSAAVQHWANNHVAQESQNKIPILHYSARILSSIMFPLFFFFIFFNEAFLTIVFSAKYVSAIGIFVCTQLVLPIRAYPFTALLQSEHRGDIINKGAMIDFVMACILMYPLYLLLGLPGVALSFVISTYWQAAYYLQQTAKLIKVPITDLVPFRILLRKFFTYGLLMAIVFLLAQNIFKDLGSIFIIGICSLIVLSVVSLWQDWTKSNPTKKTNS
jgi:O-antigen/teichoic acid export membrane protein